MLIIFVNYIIDWMLNINNSRLDLEKKYSSRIQQADLFFLRTDNNVFNIDYNIKKKNIQLKIVNITIIIILVILLTIISMTI